jgi:hypothetical protein
MGPLISDEKYSRQPLAEADRGHRRQGGIWLAV